MRAERCQLNSPRPTTCPTQISSGGGSRPRGMRLRPEEAHGASGCEVSLGVEGVVNGCIGGE